MIVSFSVSTRTVYYIKGCCGMVPVRSKAELNSILESHPDKEILKIWMYTSEPISQQELEGISGRVRIIP